MMGERAWQRTGPRGLVLCLLGLMLAGCGGAATPNRSSHPAPAKSTPAASSMTLSVAFPAYSATLWPLEYAAKTGIFKKNGLTVKLRNIHGVPQIIATIISGSMDVGFIGVDGAVHAVLKGSKLEYIGQVVDGFPQTLVVAPNIAAIKALAGKQVAGSGTGSVSNTLCLAGLEKGGIADPKTQTKYLNVAGAAPRVSMLLTHQVAAACLVPPMTEMSEAKGYKGLQYQGDLLNPWGGEGFVTKATTATAKPRALKALVASVREALKQMSQHRAAATKIGAAYMHVSSTIAMKSLSDMSAHFNSTGQWSTAGIAREFKVFSKGQRTMPKGFLNSSFLH